MTMPKDETYAIATLIEAAEIGWIPTPKSASGK